VFCVYYVIIVFFSVNCVIYVCLQYFVTVGWVLRPVKNRCPYNLYCVGGDVKPCSINQSISTMYHCTWLRKCVFMVWSSKTATIL